MAFYEVLTLPIRITQAIFAIIVLGVLAYGIYTSPPSFLTSTLLTPTAANDWSFYSSPSQVNFLIFASVWTLLAVAYLVIAPIRFRTAAHKFAILAVEAVTMIFWFAGFIALACMLNDDWCDVRTGRWGRPCQAAIAGDVFAALEW